jgi:hypothetical protein
MKMQSIHLTSALMKVKGGGTENGNRRGFQTVRQMVRMFSYVHIVWPLQEKIISSHKATSAK